MSFVFRGLTLYLAFWIGTGLVLGARPSRRSTLPNFILIVAHDLGPAELRQNGERTLVTPNLDRLMAQGLWFTNAYAGSPAGAAARASLLTGLHAGQARVRSEIQEPLAPDDITIAEVLRSVGYRSGMIGLWGLGWEGTTGHPTSQGFTEFLGALDLIHGVDERTPFLWRNEVPFSLPVFRGARQDDLPSDWLVRGATNFIRINEDVPFFLLFAPNLPGRDSSRNLPGDPALEHYTNQLWTATERARAARITRLDSQVGSLLSDLRQRHLEDNTLIIFTSVPGVGASLAGSTNRLTREPTWRTGGTGLYEGNLRVPWLVSWPGRISAGTTNMPVAAWDLLPTVAELAGASAPPGVSGRSLAPLLLGKSISTNRPAFYWESHGEQASQAGQIGSWKAILPGPQQPWELYELTDDPRETTNLAARRPDLITQFAAVFAAQARPWSPPTDGAATAAGRPGISVPTNIFKVPMRTNFIPVNPNGGR